MPAAEEIDTLVFFHGEGVINSHGGDEAAEFGDADDTDGIFDAADTGIGAGIFGRARELNDADSDQRVLFNDAGDFRDAGIGRSGDGGDLGNSAAEGFGLGDF